MLFVAVAGLAGIACAAPPETTDRVESRRITTAAARSIVAEVAAEVAALRGLDFASDVPVSVVDDATARRHMLTRLESFQAYTDLAAVQRAYAELDLLPPDADILELFLQALEQQAGGFYDPQSKSFYLLDDMPESLAPAISAHELTHALEDQHYDLDARVREVQHDDDRLFALGALHEGSASLLMNVFVARRVAEGRADAGALLNAAAEAPEQAELLARLPEVLLRQLVGPYVLGAEFLAWEDAARADGNGYPVAAVERAFRDSPLSSEQILHPEKYWDPAARDEPRETARHDAGSLLGERWERRATGVLGELSLGVLVGAETPLDPQSVTDGSNWTHPAVAGWGGDRWELWLREGDAVVMLDTVWDTAADADEFADALAAAPGRSWRARDERVVIVAGDLSKRKAGRLLERMLGVDGPAPTR